MGDILSGKVTIDGRGNFVDSTGRTVQLRGINLDGSAKFPQKPNFPSHRPLSGNEGLFFDGDNVSFVGRPFPLEEALEHLHRIKNLGYNSIRYIFTWEALEHKGPGQYDEDFIAYTVEVLKLIRQVGGLYVYLDPHQDVWSRYSGGDGAPMWTLYAAGFDPRSFEQTEAAVLENFFPHDPDAYPKMLWTTNYKRLVAGTMFALFFAGKTFAPQAVIDGVNIQDYLQRHFIKAVAHLVQRIKDLEPSLFDEVILGVESMNEPNSGYIGTPDITEIPPDSKLRLGTCPKIIESLTLGMGLPAEVDVYKITVTGPKKIGTKLIDPKGVRAWVETNEYDNHYGFKRDPGWELGACIWAQHGVWDPETQEPLIHDYFSVEPKTKDRIDEEYFINHHFLDHYRSFRDTIRAIIPENIIFLQSPTLQIPPKIKNTDLVDKNTVFCAHYYDGQSLMFKTWNSKYNVDTLGVMRGRYLNPVFGIVFGEGAIRRSFKNQLYEMKKEVIENLGESVPVIFSEIGMPFDMDDKRAYELDDFKSQTSALDALAFALEGSNLSHSWWCYTSDNCHKWGDRFNCEDFSFWSKDDDFGDLVSNSALLKTGVKEQDLPVSADSDSTTLSGKSSRLARPESQSPNSTGSSDTVPSHEGLRAVDAITRPYVIKLNGEFIDADFNLSKITYNLKLKADASTNTELPTEIFLPQWHFQEDDIVVDISQGGHFEVDVDKQVLKWYHAGHGEQQIAIKSLSAERREQEGSTLAQLLSCLCFDK